MINNLTEILYKAQSKGKKILAVAAAEDPFVLNAIFKAKTENFIQPIFIGDKEKIQRLCDQLKYDLNDIIVIDAINQEEACIKAVKMVYEGEADILMKGLVPTKTLLKQVVSKDFGLAANRILSHLALFESPNYHKVFGLTDAAMNVSPDIFDKAIIAENAISCFHKLGIDKPKTAILAAVEKVNPKMTATTDAIKLLELSKNGRLKGCIIDGPFALDNAISKEAAEHKGIHSPVAGDADILLAPDLNSGNVLYKSLSFLGNARCAAIIVGGNAPIVLTSRADSEETKYLSIILGVAISE